MTRPDPLAEPEGWQASRQQNSWRGSSGSRTTELGPHGEMITGDQICDIRVNDAPTTFGPARGQRCTLRRAVQMWVGCRNEHVGPVDVCAHHRAQVKLAMTIASVTCEYCAKAGHDVPARVVNEVELAGELASTADAAQEALDKLGWGKV
jgi:hypothetical protein